MLNTQNYFNNSGVYVQQPLMLRSGNGNQRELSVVTTFSASPTLSPVTVISVAIVTLATILIVS